MTYSFLSSSLFQLNGVPQDYNSIRPHHVVLLYTTFHYLKSTKLYSRLSNSILSLLTKGTDLALPVVYSGLIPDFLIRFGIRLRCRDHLELLKSEDAEVDHETKMKIVSQLKTMPIAINTSEANEQHYEVPAAFYDLSLGPRKKYSSGLWPTRKTTFEESEVAMLELYCQRAQIQDGMKIVDLGCGWGSLSLYLLEKYPNAQITGISNSRSQREYILRTAAAKGLRVENINIITCNVSDDRGALDVVKDNDRVLSIEM